MKQTPLGLLFGTALFFTPGCYKTSPPPAAIVKSTVQSTDLLKPALDLFRQAKDEGNYRDALHLVNSHLSKDPTKQVTPLSSQDRENLQKLYQLDNEELAELDAAVFRQLDAYYLQSCFLFRDAGRFLEVPNATPQDQARLCFDWVMRRVQLHEQIDEGLPADFVLRRGFGSGLDRAIVFLALLRQFQIEGCVLALPDEPTNPILVGALLTQDQKPNLYLFDPRLGQPIAGPDKKGIATLADVRAHPELLKPSSIVPEALSKMETYQVGPLEGLSARMRYLNDLLAFQDKVILFQDALALQRDLAKVTGREALVSNLPPAPRGQSPTRALRLFFSKAEGGIDKRDRYQRFQAKQIPWPGILQQFQEMRLYQTKDIPEPARENLLRNVKQLFVTFALQPKDAFLHGQFEATLNRIDRMRTVLETEEAAKPLEETVFKKQLQDWRARVNEAYIALLVRKEASGQAKVNSLWGEDEYLLNVLQVDSEIPLERFEKKLLSVILLNACREPLGQQVSYLVASCLHEKACQLQANHDILAAAGKDVTIVKENADYAWRNDRSAWYKYLERYQLSPQSLPKRLLEIQQRWNRGELEIAVNLWEQLHLDIHATLEARLRWVEAQKQLQTKSPALNDLLAFLDTLQKSDLSKSLNLCLEQTAAPSLTWRLGMLARDWGPRGNLYWLGEEAKRRLGITKTKPSDSLE